MTSYSAPQTPQQASGPAAPGRVHARRLRDIYRSAGWPCQDSIEVDLLAAGLIKVEPMLSAFASIDEGAQWFERLYNHEAGLMKVVLHP